MCNRRARLFFYLPAHRRSNRPASEHDGLSLLAVACNRADDLFNMLTGTPIFSSSAFTAIVSFSSRRSNRFFLEMAAPTRASFRCSICASLRPFAISRLFLTTTEKIGGHIADDRVSGLERVELIARDPRDLTCHAPHQLFFVLLHSFAGVSHGLGQAFKLFSAARDQRLQFRIRAPPSAFFIAAALPRALHFLYHTGKVCRAAGH